MKLRKRILSGLLSCAMLLTAVPFSAGTAAAASADEALVASYDFDAETLENTAGSSQATAIVTGLGNYTGTVAYADSRDGSKALQLGDYGIQLNQKNLGKTFTVSLWAKLDGSIAANQNMLFLGYHNPELWFSIAGDGNQTIKAWAKGGAYNWTHMVSVDVKNEWYLLTLTDDGENLTTYVNGAAVNTCATNSPLNGSNQDIYVGANNWDPEFVGLVDDVQVYSRALSAKEVYALYDDTEPGAILEEKGFEVTKSVKIHAEDDSKIVVTLPSGVFAEDAKIAYVSEDEAVATVDASGIVTAVAAGETVITTKVTVGEVTKEMDTAVTVLPPLGPDDPFGYLMVHFVEDSAGYAEKIYLDITRGDNPQQWDPLNGRNPILTSKSGTTGVRDPFITYCPENETYYIIATDLRVFGGDNAGWGAWQSNYSTKMNVWSSKDLITWSEGWQYDVAYNADGEKEDYYMGMMWAPETTWVDDYYGEDDGAFVVYWSSMTSDGYSKIMYGVTKDFTQDTYEFGGVFIDPGHTVIDTTILQTEDKTYHITKDNARGKELYMQVTTDERWWEEGTEWTTIQTNIGQARFGACEGPATFVDHTNDNSFYLFVDDYPTPGYQPMYTSNPDEGWEYLDTSDYFLTSNTKHGGIISLTKAQYDAIRNADAVSAVVEDLGTVDMEVGCTAEQLEAAMPEGAEVNLAYNMGVGELPVVWDLSEVDLTEEGEYEVTGIVQSIGANKNMWVGKNGSTNYQAADKELYSSLAIEVTATVVVKDNGDTPTPTPTPTPDPFRYDDVFEDNWFWDAVYYCYDEKLMTGMDEDSFGPYSQLSRAQFALILYRMAGEPGVETDKTFADITGDEWYGQAVLWAAEAGVVNGYESGSFGPADNITREQMALMMYRYAAYLEKDTENKGDLGKFSDGETVSPFATDALKWAVDKGIITGKGSEEPKAIDPQGETARCEAAAIIQRFMTAYAE